jgi:hypothetical protein
MEPEETPTTGISRRSVLKKAAVGGAVVWAAPTITSMTSPAFADGSPACVSSTCSKVEFGSFSFFLKCAPPVGFEGCPCACAGAPGVTCPSPDPCSIPFLCVVVPSCDL